eukprot:3187723-Rhodomonas_salina.1
MDKEDAFRYFHSFYVCCKRIDGQKAPVKNQNKAEEVKKKRDEPPAHNMGFQFNPKAFSGQMAFTSQPAPEEGNNIDIGMAKLMAEPEKWAGLMYQSDMVRSFRMLTSSFGVNWPKDQQRWTLWNRSCGVKPMGDGGPMTFVEAKFQALGPASFTDDVCETQEMSNYGGYQLGWRRPGRGEGLCDVPGLKLFGDVDPDDIAQGGVGNCWLVSALSALAEFDGEVMSLFKHQDLSEEGKYTVTLYDLPSRKFKEIVIDDRLAIHPQTDNLLSLRPTAENELWSVTLPAPAVPDPSDPSE